MDKAVKTIVVRADDAGVSRGTNDAMVAVARAGLVQCIGLMAPAPAFVDAAKRLAPFVDTVDLGVHATLTCEWTNLRWGPLLDPRALPGLVRDDGTFFPQVNDFVESVDPAVAKKEIRAQIAAVRAAGIEPVYLDAHMVFTWFGPMDAMMADLAKSEGLIYADRLPARGIGSPKSAADLREALGAVPTGGIALALYHPALADGDVGQLLIEHEGQICDSLPVRVMEAGFLTDPQQAGVLTAAGIQPTGYRIFR